MVVGDDPDSIAGKRALRAAIRETRRTREPDPSDAERIADHVMDLEMVRHACSAGLPVACFVSRAEEPPTTELRSRLISEGALLVAPRIQDENLVWVHVTAETTWDVNRWKIEEPLGPKFDGSPAVWIIPALAIDADGYRLGQGGGYYDRALEHVDADTPIIAIVFEQEVIPEVPREEHDHPVDIVVTPDRVRWLSMPG